MDVVTGVVCIGGVMSLTMWVGTKSGKVGVYIISKPKGQTKTTFLPTGKWAYQSIVRVTTPCFDC